MVRGAPRGFGWGDGKPLRPSRRTLSGESFERIERGRLQDWRPLLGRKVSIRYRLRGDADAALSEAIGVVQSVTDDPDGGTRVVIVNRRGETRDVPVVDVLAGKVWPST